MDFEVLFKDEKGIAGQFRSMTSKENTIVKQDNFQQEFPLELENYYLIIDSRRNEEILIAIEPANELREEYNVTVSGHPRSKVNLNVVGFRLQKTLDIEKEMLTIHWNWLRTEEQGLLDADSSYSHEITSFVAADPGEQFYVMKLDSIWLYINQDDNTLPRQQLVGAIGAADGRVNYPFNYNALNDIS